MNESDERLFARLRDLSGTLSADLVWLRRNRFDGAPRADGLRDLGERLADLGGDLIRRADDLDRAVAARLPEKGWIPEAGVPADGPRGVRLAHYVGRGTLRRGLVYLAECGRECFPFYGKDPSGHIARHPRCRRCLELIE